MLDRHGFRRKRTVGRSFHARLGLEVHGGEPLVLQLDGLLGLELGKVDLGELAHAEDTAQLFHARERDVSSVWINLGHARWKGFADDDVLARLALDAVAGERVSGDDRKLVDVDDLVADLALGLLDGLADLARHDVEVECAALLEERNDGARPFRGEVREARLRLGFAATMHGIACRLVR